MATIVLTPSQDAYIDQSIPSTNVNQGNYDGYTGNTFLISGIFDNGYFNDFSNPGPPATGGLCRFYLTFDISSIPPGATINSASLQINRFFFVTQDQTSGGADYLIDVIGDPDMNWYDENTITWNNVPFEDEHIVATGLSTISGIPSIDVTADAQDSYGFGKTMNFFVYGNDENAGIGGVYIWSHGSSNPCTVTIDYSVPATGHRRSSVVFVV